MCRIAAARAVHSHAGTDESSVAEKASEKEVLADKRVDLVRFFRHIKAGKKVVVPPHGKKIFNRLVEKPESQRSPGEFVRLQGSAFGGDPGKHFADSPGAGSLGTMLNKRLPRYQERLANTTILNSDYRSTIRRYDSPSTAFYIDPPYPEDKVQYTKYGRSIPQPKEIRDAVDGIKGKAMISYPNLPSVRKAFTGREWHIERMKVLNALYASTGTSKYRTELLITNYPARDRWKPETELG